MSVRSLSIEDRILGHFDEALRRTLGPAPDAERPSPAAALPPTTLQPAARELSGRLMRVNHTGEVCAQALYRGQAVTARAGDVQERIRRAAAEENDHLAWCADRLRQLGSRRSYLDPLWYVGSFGIGAAAGALGDRWNLGFLAETERQVVAHLDRHLDLLPGDDGASRAVLQQMRHDEGRHATTAMEAGGATLPAPIRFLMRLASQVMTRTAYWI